MNHLSFFALSASTILIGCGTVGKISQQESAFTGVFQCEGYEALSKKGNETVAPLQQIIEHKTVNGVDFLVVKRSDRKDLDKKYQIAPGGVAIYTVDGNWRYSTLVANKKMIPFKVMARFTSDRKDELEWQSEIPSYKDNRGVVRESMKLGGKFWIDSKTGDKKSKVNFVNKIITCKRQNEVTVK